MITLEQVKLLDTRVTKTVEYITMLTTENTLLKEQVDTYQRRIDELEVLVQAFREEQEYLEDGILSTLDRLNQFEDALENKLSQVDKKEKPPAASGSPDRSVLKEPLSAASQVEQKPEERAVVRTESLPELPEEPEEAGADESGDSDPNVELDIF